MWTSAGITPSCYTGGWLFNSSMTVVTSGAGTPGFNGVGVAQSLVCSVL